MRINLKNIVPILLGIFIAPQLTAQSWDVSLIPDSLTKNAYSVVRNSHQEYKGVSKINGDESRSYVITILNEKGKDEADFVCYCDNFRELKKFSGEVYDRNGKLIRKIKKSDLKYSEYSQGLATDGKYYFYEPATPYYPITIKYDWEIKNKKGIVSFGLFMPQSSYNQSVEKASFQLTLPSDMAFKHHASQMEKEPVKENNGNFTSYKWQKNYVPALESEIYGPPFTSLVPMLFASPIDFAYDGREGSLSDWKEYGIWVNQLLQGRDQLPATIIEKIKELTKDAATDREKVKILYDYLGETTRYVSIQLGIGGFQPMPAMEVCSTGFGDCKALTNYMKAMLKELGIPAYYTEIHTKKKHFIPDFPSFSQTNHVVLQVPLPEDTLWLECTNPQIPFGYVHKSIAGNDGLIIKENGGEVYRLPIYPDSLNCENQEISLKISQEGKVTASIKYEAHLMQYESIMGFNRLTPKEQTDLLRRNVRVPQASIRNISITENKDSHPSMNISYELSSDQFGSKTGSRLFIPINAFRVPFSRLNAKDRKNDIFINYGYKDTDIITFELPEGATVESTPPIVLINKDYGSFLSFVQVEENKIRVIQSLHLKAGRYDASKFEEFVDFRKSITDSYESKVIIKMN